MIMMLLDVQSVGHSCARTHNKPFYSREPERYYPYYPVHTNAFSKVCVFVIMENASIISRPHYSFEAFSTVQTNMMCMRFRFDPLSRAF